ncbi:MAG: Cna B-type domain-containing protein [Clostridiales bacterium]|nr:Cna B-type domain-containing protein [Clostridiales bacterium]
MTYYHVDLRVEGSIEITVTDTEAGQTNVTVEKVWDDDDNAAGARPTSITVYLTDSDGNKVTDSDGNYYTAVLNASNGWTYTWEDVNLTAGTYTAVENSVDGYTLESATTFNITSSDTSSSSSVTYTGTITVTALSDLTVYKYGDLSSEGITVPMSTTYTTDENNGAYEFQSVSGHGEDGQAPSTVLSDYVVLEENDVIAVTVTYSYTYYTDDSSEAVTGTASTTIYVTVHQSENECEEKGTADDRTGYDFTISAEDLLSTENIIITTDKVTLTNTLDEDTTTSLTIVKMDEDDKDAGADDDYKYTYLSGAEFILYYTETDETTGETTTYYYSGDDEDGNATWTTERSAAETIISEGNEDGVTVSGLTLGTTYYLEEITAPNGYNLLSDPIVFTLTTEGINLSEEDGINDTVSYETDEDGNLIIIVYNSKGYELPSTGGMGTWLYTLTGLVLCGGAATVLYRRKRLS